MYAANVRLAVLSTALLAFGATAGCASTSAPAGWLPPPDEAPRGAHGGWVEVRTPSRQLEGELIALSADSLYVLPQDGTLAVVATSGVTEARLAYAGVASGALAAWGTLGTLSTLSHGAFLILSAPVWLITAGVTASMESHAHKLSYPPFATWGALRPYARFPQGLPEGLHRRSLRPTPPVSSGAATVPQGG